MGESYAAKEKESPYQSEARLKGKLDPLVKCGKGRERDELRGGADRERSGSKRMSCQQKTEP